MMCVALASEVVVIHAANVRNASGKAVLKFSPAVALCFAVLAVTFQIQLHLFNHKQCSNLTCLMHSDVGVSHATWASSERGFRNVLGPSAECRAELTAEFGRTGVVGSWM